MEVTYCPLRGNKLFVKIQKFNTGWYGNQATDRLLSGKYNFLSQLSYALLFVSVTRWVKVREVFILFCGLCDSLKKNTQHRSRTKECLRNFLLKRKSLPG